MKIERQNLKFNRLAEIDNIIENACLFDMEQADIDSDENVRGEILQANESMYVFLNIEENHCNERYCYLKTKTMIGQDNKTQMIIIERIITDAKFISESFFTRIFTILLQQNDNQQHNRIVVGTRINERFHGAIDTTSKNISQYICDLFSCFTGENCPYYEI